MILCVFVKIVFAYFFIGTSATARVAESRVALRFENYLCYYVSFYFMFVFVCVLFFVCDELFIFV